MSENSTLESNQTSNGLMCVNYTRTLRDSRTCEFIVNVYFISPICIIGFFGNCIAIAVLRRDPDKGNTTNWLLKVLAVFDGIYLALAFASIGMETISHSQPNPVVQRVHNQMQPYLRPLLAIAAMITIGNVAMVTVDRYLAICQPFDTKWRTLRRMKMATLVIIIVSIICNIPIFFVWKAERLQQFCNSEEYFTRVDPTPTSKNTYFIFYRFGYAILYQVASITIVAILNVRIAWTLKELNQKLREMTREVKEERNLTKMLIIVVTIFIVCQLPGISLSLAAPFPSVFPVEIRRCAIHISNALLTFNSSINFVVYCLVWKKFNTILLRMMNCTRADAIK